jgi:hypothetical protein
MRGGASVLAVALVVLLAACGSGSGGWQVVKEVKSTGSSPGFIDNASVARPADIEVAVTASPSIDVHTTYAFICGDVTSDSTTVDSPTAKTPATLVLEPPSGPPNACRVNVLVSKSHPADMTVTLRMRGVPASKS